MVMLKRRIFISNLYIPVSYMNNYYATFPAVDDTTSLQSATGWMVLGVAWQESENSSPKLCCKQNQD